MSKMHINIVIPAAEKKIELKVSPKLKIGSITHMLGEYLSSSGISGFTATKSVCLCDAESGTKYSENICLSELNICDGHEMLFI